MEKEIDALKFASEQVRYATALVQFSKTKVIGLGAAFTLLGYLIGRAG